MDLPKVANQNCQSYEYQQNYMEYLQFSQNISRDQIGGVHQKSKTQKIDDSGRGTNHTISGAPNTENSPEWFDKYYRDDSNGTLQKVNPTSGRHTSKLESKKTKKLKEQLKEKVKELKLQKEKYEAKLSRSLRKEKAWLEAVAAWRAKYEGHRDYHKNHPDEIKFRRMKLQVDRVIKNAQKDLKQCKKTLKRIKGWSQKD